ncbi:Flagellar motor switch protein FliN [Caldisalinibacter kiritimatiensis]|uniref:Flagellar motor switch protein FliN n=2 Tax=Caldisalinibacter kiritimatiensis TaxID=1304284 RepID=R1ASS7_9FIRM|nr:Flagellar motor switch protein FliN [Caldisalinibacter kiritimatiensis]
MTSEMLSQEEIDALLKGDLNNTDDEPVDNNTSHAYYEDDLVVLDETEKDALGEIGNISMGTAATTLFTLLNQKVTITTPEVEVVKVEDLGKLYKIPFVAVDVKYKLGLTGTNLLILKVDDVKVITDLMMGGDGTNIDRELNEMDLSAISEAMNQMVGSSCTSLSEMFGEKIDIEPPNAFEINFVQDNKAIDILNYDDSVVKVSFRMIVGDLIDSQIMQLIPLNFAKKMVNKILNIDEKDNELENKVDNVIEQSKNQNDDVELYTQSDVKLEEGVNEAAASITTNQNTEKAKPQSKPVNVKKVQFQAFDETENNTYNESIDLISEVPIEITVQLGKTVKKISEILEYGPGTIIELDKLVGEPLDILANGKYIAKGEVVVIDDNFGIRITDIIKPSKRVTKL